MTCDVNINHVVVVVVVVVVYVVIVLLVVVVAAAAAASVAVVIVVVVVVAIVVIVVVSRRSLHTHVAVVVARGESLTVQCGGPRKAERKQQRFTALPSAQTYATTRPYDVRYLLVAHRHVHGAQEERQLTPACMNVAYISRIISSLLIFSGGSIACS